MEENKSIQKNIEAAADLPAVPRKEDGSIDLEKISTGKDEKNNYIIPDEILESFYRELPDGTTNQENNKWVYHGGILRKANREVQIAGGEALKAKYSQRRRLSETIDYMLRKRATAEEIEELGLEDGATKQDALIAAMFRRAIEQKDVQASAFLRDTAGEKPSEKISAEVTQLTAEDREMLERVQKRLEEI